MNLGHSYAAVDDSHANAIHWNTHTKNGEGENVYGYGIDISRYADFKKHVYVIKSHFLRLKFTLSSERNKYSSL